MHRSSSRHGQGRSRKPTFQPLSALALVLAVGIGSELTAEEPPRFSRDILPILADNCFGCHGPDASHRKAELRLDTREGAVAVLAPGQPEESELLARVTEQDSLLHMPPANSRKQPLTTEQVATLRRWIAAGAPWGKHWSLEPPIQSTPPGSAIHPIDAFVLDRLRREGLDLASEANRATLARRLALDLTGLPPTLADAAIFIKDTSNDGYEHFVDQLLKSPHFGERMAMWWLDAARYADTDGYQGEETRTNWPWRDWVVSAFNDNMPFDQFTIEQFAGDLLANATPEQRLATCFHRNHMTNGEGGRDPEESRIDYVIDRVNTMGTVWLGLTLGCCQCHSHKFDPISHKDYYALSAFFNSIDEDGKAGKSARPYLSYQSPTVDRAIAEAKRLRDQRKLPVEQASREAEPAFLAWLDQQVARTRDGFVAWHPLKKPATESSEGTKLEVETDGIVEATGPNPNQEDYRVSGHVAVARVTGVRLEVFPHESHTNGSYSRGKGGYFVLTDVKIRVRKRGSSQVREIMPASAIADVADDPKKHDGYGDVKHVLDDDPRNGWSTRDSDPKQPRMAVFTLADPLVLDDDEEFVFELRHRSTLGDANIGRFRVAVTDQPASALARIGPTPLEELAAARPSDSSRIEAALRERLKQQFLADHSPSVVARAALDRAERQLKEAEAARKVDVMVLAERARPRDTHVLVRGVWDKKGEQVSRDAPLAIAPWPSATSAPESRSRLDLARWLVARDNPLTARVLVNHVWQMLFGAGLVRTAEDFGLQGERPTHPELLDWLAVDLMEHGWDVKRLIKQIVTSRTYRQSSEIPPGLLARDPENRLLARGARFRLPSWMLRDAALASAGLLNLAVGGPPVKPHQPDGVWEEMFMGRFHYEPSEGPAQYRRTLYAFWRRAVAPTFLFDSAQRRVCEVRPARTNTPLQALTLLNDASQLAAAHALSRRAISQAADPPGRLSAIMQAVLLRPPSNREQPILSREYERALAHYRSQPDQAARLLRGTSPDPDQNQGLDGDDAPERASLVIVASLVLNLDEAITHE